MNNGRSVGGICTHVQRNQPNDIIKYIVDAATTKYEREREREGEKTLNMIRLLCTASDRMEVWLSSDDAIRVKRLHENIRSLTGKIASLFLYSIFFSIRP
jgi:hypothetical protein